MLKIKWNKSNIRQFYNFIEGNVIIWYIINSKIITKLNDFRYQGYGKGLIIIYFNVDSIPAIYPILILSSECWSFSSKFILIFKLIWKIHIKSFII
jgi:hypothetical protein